MGQAEQLSQAASQLTSTASAYTGAANEIQGIMGLTSGVAYGLGATEGGWQGQGYQAFTTAWKQVYGDGEGLTGALTGASGVMTQLAQTINEQLPAIQKAEALAQINMDYLRPAALAAHEQALNSAQTASDAALSTISTRAYALASTVGELETKVGVCNAGTGETPPTAGTAPVSVDYAQGFLAGLLAAAGASGGDGGGTPPPAGPDSCDPDSPNFRQRLLEALKNNFTGRGLVWSLLTGVAGGAANTTNNLLSSGLSQTTINAFIGSALGGTTGPVSLTVANLIAPSIVSKCGLDSNRKDNVVSLIMSVIGGVFVGGVIEHYGVQPFLPHGSSTPHPTPNPTAGPAPTPTH